ncbi:MAG: hypothetical protein KDD25_06890 [Bdellovibrionales bacterium]|nr:hypothetical protein [Bdellovibrionales bacterium]
MTTLKMLSILLVLTILPSLSIAEEESISFDDVEDVKVELPKSSVGEELRSHLMGRIDLTSEFSPYDNDEPEENHEFKNYHFFVFLKVKASDRTEFFGEIIGQKFYFVNLKVNNPITFSFGKIPVPFGDSTSYHRYYGGVQGLGSDGVLFPIVWAENGFNIRTQLNPLAIETYMVNGFTELDETTGKPKLNVGSNGSRQAGGARLSLDAGGVTPVLSYYHMQWRRGDSLNLIGGDLSSSYGLWDLSLFKHLRLGMGRAVAFIDGHQDGTFQKAGDYAKIATNLLGPVEFQLLYGTFTYDSSDKSEKDTHAFTLSGQVPWDQVRLTLEYQWNFEAENEVENDILRLMASLDF